MRRRLIGSFVLLALGACASSSRSDEAISWTLHSIDRPVVNWKLVAQSDLIVRGSFKLTPGNLAILSKRSAAHVSLPLSISHVYASVGSVGDVEVRYYAAPSGRPTPTYSGPTPQAIEVAADKEAVFFLVQGPDDYYFAGHTPDALVPGTVHFERLVQDEVLKQKSLASRVAKFLEGHKPPLDDRVGEIVGLARKGKTQAALDELLGLGQRAVPAMVKRLGDRRILPSPAISIHVPGAFEGLSHYRVRDVGDFLMFVLHHGTEVSLGWPDENASAQVRRRYADSWRIWLGYSLRLDA
jgi:hypothetical protein